MTTSRSEPAGDLITSLQNPLVKRVRQLSDRKYRRREQAYFVEGLQPVWRAVAAGVDLDTLIVAPELLTNEAALELVADAERAGTTVARVSRDIFVKLSERDGPAGLAAIVRGSIGTPADLTVEADSVFVALHEVHNPGNLGTVIRTADASGAAGVILIGATADPHAPAAVKASMGSLFAVDVVHADDLGQFFAWAGEHSVEVVMTSGGAGADHWDATYPRPVAVLLGSEGDGLPSEVLERGRSVRIPMQGTAESLNLAVAAALMLYEVTRKPGVQP